jgi:AhpD family alkylhydroperoxidase
VSTIAALDPAATQGAVKSTLDAVQSALGVTPNLHRVLANAPAALAFYSRGEAALARTTLSGAQREQIALAVAQINGCDYCLSAHTVLGGGAGTDIDFPVVHAADRAA